MSDPTTIAVLPMQYHRFTVDEYHRMVDAGILGEDHRVELLRGVIAVRAKPTPRHSACVMRLNDAFGEFDSRALCSAHAPITFPDSEPQPDFALLDRREDYYASGHPRAADVKLIVEVADSSLRVDRELKGPLYAENGIPEYWLVDLAADTIEVCAAPENGEWTRTRTVGREDTLVLSAFPDFESPASRILP